jgi:ABC-2 type transport system ATP-binding protein
LIEVQNLTRTYGPRRAVDDLTFTVRPGEVVAFLGPNGAGKSTTLRILAGYLPPTAGAARVGGRDVIRESKAARALLGYMPETVPLYPEMTVRGYLRFRARLKGVRPRDLPGRLDDVIARCRLQEMTHRPIGMLSRGYRQRVGLADALVAAPPVLVLDEPTAGLDPNQILEVRSLILPEAEAVSDRVLILHRGRLVAEGTPAALRERAGAGPEAVLVEGTAPARDAAAALAALRPGLAALVLRETEPFRARVTGAADPALRASVARLFADRGWALTDLRREAPSLEEVFARLTIGEDA